MQMSSQYHNSILVALQRFFITGLQLEVGSQATPFEHRSFGEELALCQRYYYQHVMGWTLWNRRHTITMQIIGYMMIGFLLQ